MILWPWLLVAGASDLCGDRPVESLERAVAAVGEQYAALDEAAFDRASKQLDAAVSCLDVVPPGPTVARLHQAMALIAFVNGQRGAARSAMAAARLADPAWRLDDQLFPQGHPYQAMYEAATDPGPVRAIGEIDPKWWIIDGIERGDAPTARAFLVQVRDGDTIAQAAYLYAFDDLPDLGQAQSAAPWAVPRRLTLGADLALRFLGSQQDASGPGLSDQEASAVGLGGAVSVRATPIAFVGLELALAGLGGADPLLGRTMGVEGRGVALLGAATRIGKELQLFGNARFGYARDLVVAWSDGADGATQGLWPLNNLLTGVEAGARTDGLDVRAVGDLLLAGGSSPYEVRVGAVGATRIAGPVAAQLDLSGRSGSLEIVGGDGAPIGLRNDVELRLGLGVALWVE